MPKTTATKKKKDFNASSKAKAATKKGKSLGTFIATAYGPPWVGIQGTGVTSQGTKLPSGVGPQAGYLLIAGDPTVLKYGSWYFINPNPFNTDRPFKMDDTGGPEFHGGSKRIDFLVLAGREAQNRWGRKPVTVREASGPNDKTNAGSGSESAATEKTTTVRVPYKFKVGAGEDYWTAIQRLADEVRFRAFMRDGEFWYASDNYLAAQPPAASITPTSPYLIGQPNFDMDNGKRAFEATLTVLA